MSKEIIEAQDNLIAELKKQLVDSEERNRLRRFMDTDCGDCGGLIGYSSNSIRCNRCGCEMCEGCQNADDDSFYVACTKCRKESAHVDS